MYFKQIALFGSVMWNKEQYFAIMKMNLESSWIKRHQGVKIAFLLHLTWHRHPLKEQQQPPTLHHIKMLASKGILTGMKHNQKG